MIVGFSRALTVGLTMLAAGPDQDNWTSPPAYERVRLDDVWIKQRQDFPEHPLAYVRAFAEYQSKQPAKRGLVVVLELVNEGSQPLDLVHVTGDSIVIHVFNAEGVEVVVPDPLIGVDWKGPPGRKKYKDPYVRPGFSLMGPPWAWRDPKIKVLQEAVDNDGKIHLEPGERFQTAVLVKKVMCEPDAWWAEIKKRSVPIEQMPQRLDPPLPPAEYEIPAGKYAVRVVISASLAGERGWSFGSERFTVELVGPDEPGK